MGSALEGHVLFSFHLANNPVNICSQDQKLSWIYISILNAKKTWHTVKSRHVESKCDIGKLPSVSEATRTVLNELWIQWFQIYAVSRTPCKFFPFPRVINSMNTFFNKQAWTGFREHQNRQLIPQCDLKTFEKAFFPRVDSHLHSSMSPPLRLTNLSRFHHSEYYPDLRKKEIQTRATTQMNRKDIMINEIGWSQKDKHCYDFTHVRFQV